MDLRFWLLLQLALLSVASGNLVFNVHSKFKGRHRSLTDFKAHDLRRHGRSLSAVDFPLGGNGSPSKSGLYFTKIGLGSPAKDYHVQIDSGSDILWVNCASCKNCPKKSDLGMNLTLYDAKSSSSSKTITCDHDFCTSAINGSARDCKSGFSCPYSIEYGDGTSTAGYYVKDNIVLDQVSGDLQTSSMTEPVIFGCGAGQSGEQGVSVAPLDGILGLGQVNTSVISQLAAAGKVKKMFAHCLDTKIGGGIFTIGEVVKPEITKIPIVPNRTHYNIVLKEIEVEGEVLKIPPDTFNSGDSREAVIDSGTTLVYLPDDIYGLLMAKIVSRTSSMKKSSVEDSFLCFTYSGSMLSAFEEFPTIKFHFQKSLTLTVQPSEYLFSSEREGIVCAGWQSSGIKTDGKPMILLGDMVLGNKLVVYDLEDQAIGWTDYDCSSDTTKVKDENGRVHTVSSHNIFSTAGQKHDGSTTRTLLLLFMWIAMLFKFVD